MNFENILILPNVIEDRSRRRFGGIFIKFPKVTSAWFSLPTTLRTQERGVALLTTAWPLLWPRHPAHHILLQQPALPQVPPLHSPVRRFHSDHSLYGSGFRILWDSTATGCGGEVTAPSGSIMSPNYPAAYHHQAECLWTIKVGKGSR